jgi:hypothetical protein
MTLSVKWGFNRWLSKATWIVDNLEKRSLNTTNKRTFPDHSTPIVVKAKKNIPVACKAGQGKDIGVLTCWLLLLNPSKKGKKIKMLVIDKVHQVASIERSACLKTFSLGPAGLAHCISSMSMKLFVHPLAKTATSVSCPWNYLGYHAAGSLAGWEGLLGCIH